MSAGLTQYGEELDITNVSTAQLDALVLALTDTDRDYNLARAAKQTASNNYQATLPALAKFLSGSRGVLMGYFGPTWNTQWAQAGFITPSTAVPEQVSSQLSLALRLVTFFTANPGYQNAGSGVTAVIGRAARKATMDARNALATAIIALRGKQQLNNAAFAALLAPEFTLLKVLEGVLAADDPRWLAFGLNIPGTPSTPGKPTNLQVTYDITGGVLVQWDAVPLAKTYRGRTRIVGMQAEYQLAFSVKEPMGAITGVAAGVTVEVVVQAVNGNLQGAKSDPIVVTMPMPNAPRVHTVEPAAELAPLLAITPNGNGNGNGKSHRGPARV